MPPIIRGANGTFAGGWLRIQPSRGVLRSQKRVKRLYVGQPFTAKKKARGLKKLKTRQHLLIDLQLEGVWGVVKMAEGQGEPLSNQGVALEEVKSCVVTKKKSWCHDPPKRKGGGGGAGLEWGWEECSAPYHWAKKR